MRGSVPRGFVAMLLVAALVGCGGSDQDERSATVTFENPLDSEPLPEGGLSIEGIDNAVLLPTQVDLRFGLTGTRFDATPAETSVWINGRSIDAGAITISESNVVARVQLDEGRNNVRFKSYDTLGRPLYLERSVWAGSNTLNVRLEDADGRLLTAPADLTLRMSDDPSVGKALATATGTVSIANVPSRTVHIEARSATGLFGMIGATGEDGDITLRLHQVGSASTIDNNDFAQGIDGWELDSSQALIIPHVEDIVTGTVPRTGATTADRMRSASLSTSGDARREHARAAPDNNDLQITTRGAGPQKASRTFKTHVGTRKVTVRFRFVTSEVPNGFFGSQYNDYYAVTLRSQRGGTVSTESHTMNGLGLQSFDSGGSTAWRTLSLETDPAGDQVQVEATVANTADHLLDSHVLIDFVHEDASPVNPALQWDPNTGGAVLTFQVTRGPLATAMDIKVYWAAGPNAGDRLGNPILTHQIPAGTPAGAGGPIAINGHLLLADPASARYLIATVGDANVSALRDVQLSYGPHADASAASAELVDVIKDSLRVAGSDKAVISRTAVQPADQARAMFQNLTRPPGPLTANVAQQLAIYAPPGDAVIQVFNTHAQGMTLEQARLNAGAIQAAMTNEILAQGPDRVSKHCADPSKVSVVDIPLSSFNGSGAPRFKSSAAARVTKLLDENSVYHLELNK